MSDFLSGIIVSLCATAGLYFLRFRRQTKDHLFGVAIIDKNRGGGRSI